VVKVSSNIAIVTPSYVLQFSIEDNRLSRYDVTGLCWLLEGRPVVALTADTAAIGNPTGNITTYRRFNKPSYGPAIRLTNFE
jgi:hypothetical protein